MEAELWGPLQSNQRRCSVCLNGWIRKKSPSYDREWVWSWEGAAQGGHKPLLHAEHNSNGHMRLLSVPRS